MRGKRVKALRTEARPHPGRKHGGSRVEEAKAIDEHLRKRSALRQAIDNVFKPKPADECPPVDCPPVETFETER